LLHRLNARRAADRRHAWCAAGLADALEDAHDYGAVGDEGVRSLRDFSRCAGCAFTKPLRGSLGQLHEAAARRERSGSTS